jgi:DNA-directed RNA polymerase specialized sigma24 family protein
MHFYWEGHDIVARLSNPRFQWLLRYHAWRLYCSSPGPVDDGYHEDLYQEGMLAAYRLLERDPGMYGRTLVRLCVLAMYAARRRGRSVFRADPAQRLRVYEQEVFDLDEISEADRQVDWAVVEQFAGEIESVQPGEPPT